MQNFLETKFFPIVMFFFKLFLSFWWLTACFLSIKNWNFLHVFVIKECEIETRHYFFVSVQSNHCIDVFHDLDVQPSFSSFSLLFPFLFTLSSPFYFSSSFCLFFLFNNFIVVVIVLTVDLFLSPLPYRRIIVVVIRTMVLSYPLLLILLLLVHVHFPLSFLHMGLHLPPYFLSFRSSHLKLF